MFGIGRKDNRGPAPGGDTSEGWRPWLRARLLQNTATRTETGNQGIAVTVTTRKPDFMRPPLSWIVPVRKARTYHLDAVGSRVWDLCAKKSTVEQIIDIFSAEYGLSFHEARVMLANYTRDLIQRGLLVIVYEEQDDDKKRQISEKQK